MAADLGQTKDDSACESEEAHSVLRMSPAHDMESVDESLSMSRCASAEPGTQEAKKPGNFKELELDGRVVIVDMDFLPDIFKSTPDASLTRQTDSPFSSSEESSESSDPSLSDELSPNFRFL